VQRLSAAPAPLTSRRLLDIPYRVNRDTVKISSRGLYALKALTHLAEAYQGGLVRIHEIAEEEEIPEKFLEAILVTLKNARIVTSRRGRQGGYRLRRPPGEIRLGDVIRVVDGPLAPFGDAVELAYRVKTEPRHAGLFDLFLDVRNAAAAILDHTSLADLVRRNQAVLAGRGRPRRARA
jgi:Rrf2 family protein